jgi:hypothetical protein
MVKHIVAELGAEFRGAQLGDDRRNARLIQLAESMAKNPDTSFPKALSEAGLEAAYRFFSNVKVEPEQILRPHIEQTLARMAGSETLVVHDSTKLSFSSEYREGLATRGDTQQLLVHCSLALKADGSRTPLGVLALSRHVPTKTKKRLLQERWGEHVQTVHGLGISVANAVHLMDREADDYELFDQLTRIGARFVVRMHHDRALGTESVRESLERAQVRTERGVVLTRRGKQAGSKQRQIHPPRNERTAQLAIATHRVTIPRTRSARNAINESVSLNVVHVWEVEPPSGQKPVDWVLYTSEPIDTPEQILQVVDWYRARWTIEEYFKALKTGCAMEKRQLADSYALSNALALLAPIAWRLLLLRNEARDQPKAPATQVFEPDEIEVLRAAVVKRRRLPENPTVLDAMLSIASLGGHLKHNGPPGWQTLAGGYEKLCGLVDGWRLRCAAEPGFLPQLRDQS